MLNVIEMKLVLEINVLLYHVHQIQPVHRISALQITLVDFAQPHLLALLITYAEIMRTKQLVVMEMIAYVFKLAQLLLIVVQTKSVSNQETTVKYNV